LPSLSTRWTKLVKLDVSNNSLSGVIPSVRNKKKKKKDKKNKENKQKQTKKNCNLYRILHLAH